MTANVFHGGFANVADASRTSYSIVIGDLISARGTLARPFVRARVFA